MAEGSIVQMLWGSGNRDASAFAEPDRFDADRYLTSAGSVERRDRPIVTFGHGIHLCPGAPLARLQIRIAFEELLGRFSRLELAPDNTFRYFRSQILRGLTGVWVDLTP